MDWYHKGSSLFSHLGLSQMCSMLTFLMVDRFLSFLDIIETTKGKLHLELICKLEGSMIEQGVKIRLLQRKERGYTQRRSVCESDDEPGVSRI
ncbi:hypothetical protein HanRHA438_Chr14g0644291 [Helianthus annuus]|nr:hypothetical protein HanRHA438_Chr14g0644291 [Helianthus annuus]